MIRETYLEDPFEEMDEEKGIDEENPGEVKKVVREEEERGDGSEGESREVTEKHGGTGREMEFGIRSPEFGIL